MKWFDKLLHFIHQKLINPPRIKVGDVVRYDGLESRVMEICTLDDRVVLSELQPWERVPLRKLKLVESIKSFNFKPGDMVTINDITNGEMNAYIFNWVTIMDEIIDSGEAVEVIRAEPRSEDGQIVVVNWDGLWVPFMTYHIELVVDYDIV